MIANIQALRFLAALGVAILHCGMFHGVTPGFLIGGAGVDAFFVISGFIMVVSSWNEFGTKGAARRYFHRRLVRIFPLYWIASAALVWGLWFNGFLAIDPPTRDTVQQILFGSLLIPVYLGPFLLVGWSLNYEMLFYVLFGIAIRWPRAVAIISVTAVIVVLAAVGYYFGVADDKTLTSGFPRYWLGPLLLEFVWGMAVGVIYQKRVQIAMPVAAVLAIVGAAVAIYYVLDIDIKLRELRIGLPAALFLTGIIYLPQLSTHNLFGRSIVLLGDSSYALYLFHWVLFSTFQSLSQPAGLAIAVAGSVMIHRLIEAPLLRVLRHSHAQVAITVA